MSVKVHSYLDSSTNITEMIAEVAVTEGFYCSYSVLTFQRKLNYKSSQLQVQRKLNYKSLIWRTCQGIII